MSAEVIVYNALSANAALGAFIANAGSPTDYRIYPDGSPQATTFPMVTYEVLNEDEVKSLDGSSNLARTLMQVICFHKSRTSARAMADAVEAALFGNFATFDGIKENRSSFYDEVNRVYAVSQDFAIWA